MKDPLTKHLRTLLLRLALGRSTFGYMLRSIKSDPRTPGARMVDIVVRQDAVERRIEADWVKQIATLTQHLSAPEVPMYPYQRLPWWHLLWRRVWCPLDGHGGLATTAPDGVFGKAALCKRCGATVKLV